MTSKSSDDFVFPWLYQFPPFFTIQPNKSTLDKQLDAWRSLILDYCQKKKITSIDVTEISSSPLFNNTKINRRLSKESILIVLEDLKAHGHLEWRNKEKTRANIFWRTPEEWGSLIYNWAQQNGYSNTVCTFYELREGEETSDQPFHGLEIDVLVKALKTLELNKKAEVFPNNEGVKFF